MNRKTAAVHVLQGKAAGAASGGTIASLFGAMFDESKDEIRLAADPYCLNPPGSHRWPLHPVSLTACSSSTPVVTPVPSSKIAKLVVQGLGNRPGL